MLLPDNNLQIGHQKDAFNWERAMRLGCKPIFLAEKSQVYILFIDRFFLDWKFISTVLVLFFGKKRRRYTCYYM